jgi:tetratricopeptide (TPR) repeat protein
MTHKNPNFFTNRSTTKDFLFSHSEDRVEKDHDDKSATRIEKDPIEAFETDFSGILDRQGLINKIETDWGSVPSLSVMAIAFQQSNSTIPGGEKEQGSMEKALVTLTGFCEDKEGGLARISTYRFACALPHVSEKEAKKLADELMASLPENQPPRTLIGIAAYPIIDYTLAQILENAEKALEHGEFFGPGTVTLFNAVSLNISGDRHYQNGDILGAIDDFKKGLLLDPTDVNLHNSLGVCYGVQEEYDAALRAFENAIELAPDEIMPIYNKGYVLSAKGEKEEAMQCFLAANAKEPDIFEVVFHIGQTLLEDGDAEKAKPFLENAVRINSRSGPANKSLGSCLKKLGLNREALQAYKTAVKINPSDAQSLSDLGQLYLQLEESLDVATVFSEQSVRLEPDNALFRYHLGCTYLQREMLDLALNEFEEAEAMGHDTQAKIEEVHQQMMKTKAS